MNLRDSPEFEEKIRSWGLEPRPSEEDEISRLDNIVEYLEIENRDLKKALLYYAKGTEWDYGMIAKRTLTDLGHLSGTP